MCKLGPDTVIDSRCRRRRNPALDGRAAVGGPQPTLEEALTFRPGKETNFPEDGLDRLSPLCETSSVSCNGPFHLGATKRYRKL